MTATDNKEVLSYITQSFDLKRQGFYKPAIEMLYKALTIENNNVEILSQLAELYYLLENYQRAINYIEKTLELNPLHIDCLKLMKTIYLKDEDYIEAQKAAVKIYELNPTVENLAERIRILNKIGDFETVENIEHMNCEFDDEIYYQFAVAHYQIQDYEKAIEYLEKAKTMNPEKEKTEIFLAEVYYLNNDFEKSKELFLKYKDRKEDALIMNYLGLFKLDENKIEEAINYFSIAVKLKPQNAQYAYNLSNAYIVNGWFDEAVKYMNIAICLEPENCEYRYTQAYSYYTNSQYEKSIIELKNILKINPDYTNAKILEALIKGKSGDPVSAKVALDKIVKENPENVFAISSLAKIDVELEQIDLACELMKKVIVLEPTILNKTEYSNMLIENESYGEAQEIIEQILEENPKYIDGYILQAKNYIFVKDYDGAFDSAQQIIELDQNNPEGYFYNAQALFELGDTNFALESMKKAISLDVNNAMYYVQMGEFYQKLGKNEEALAYIGEAASIDESAKNKELYANLASIVRKSKQIPEDGK
ncbi:tetratricopeptide repeat protein [bacterium]|nr:tetratricopeptide repeat protein [bacterium]